MSNNLLDQAFADLDSANLDRQIAALQRLRSQSDSRIAPRVIPLLKSANPALRQLAAEVLRRNPSPNAVTPLIDALYDEVAHVRAAAAETLGYLNDRAAVPPLIDALYDEDAEVRFAAAHSLGMLADPRSVIDLIHMLDTEEDHALVMMAAQALRNINTPEAAAAIQHLRENDGESYIFDEPNLDRTIPHAAPAREESDELEETVRGISYDRLKDYFEGEDQESADTTQRGVPHPQAQAVLVPRLPVPVQRHRRHALPQLARAALEVVSRGAAPDRLRRGPACEPARPPARGELQDRLVHRAPGQGGAPAVRGLRRCP